MRQPRRNNSVVAVPGCRPLRFESLEDRLVLSGDDTTAPAISFSLSAASLTEGELLHATVTLSAPAAADLAIVIDESHAGQFDLPTATIPAGQSSATFPIAARDDSIIEKQKLVTLTARTAGSSAAAAVTVLDDDVPAVTLTLMPAGSGARESYFGVVTRSIVSDQSFTVKLVASHPLLVDIPTSLVIPASEAAMVFSVTPQFLQDVPGDMVTITANGVYPECGCRIQPGASATLEVASGMPWASSGTEIRPAPGAGEFAEGGFIASTIAAAGASLALVDATGAPLDAMVDSNTVVVGAATWCSACAAFKQQAADALAAGQFAGKRIIFAFGNEGGPGPGGVAQPEFLTDLPGEVAFLAAGSARPERFPSVYNPATGQFDLTVFEALGVGRGPLANLELDNRCDGPPPPYDTSITFAQVNRVVGQEATVLTVNDAGAYSVAYRPNSELGYLNPDTGDLLTCGFYPGTTNVPVLDCSPSGNVSNLVGMQYANGQLIAADAGNTVYHRDGSIMRSGGTWTYDAGAMLKSSANYWWSNGTQMKLSSTFFHPNGTFLRNFLYYSDGFLYSDPPDLYFPNGQLLRVLSDYVYETGDSLRTNGVIYYPSGQVMVDAIGNAFEPQEVGGDLATLPFSHFESFTDSEVNIVVTDGFSEIVTAIGTISFGSGAAFLNYSKLTYAPRNPASLAVASTTSDSITFTFDPPGGSAVDYVIAWAYGATPPATPEDGYLVAGSPFTIDGLDPDSQIAVRLFARSADCKLSSAAILLASTAPLDPTADFDADDDVDGADFLAWQRGFGLVGLAVARADGDADDDHDVDAADFGYWSSQFGSPPPALAAAAISSSFFEAPSVVVETRDAGPRVTRRQLADAVFAGDFTQFFAPSAEDDHNQVRSYRFRRRR